MSNQGLPPWSYGAAAAFFASGSICWPALKPRGDFGGRPQLKTGPTGLASSSTNLRCSRDRPAPATFAKIRSGANVNVSVRQPVDHRSAPWLEEAEFHWRADRDGSYLINNSMLTRSSAGRNVASCLLFICGDGRVEK